MHFNVRLIENDTRKTFLCVVSSSVECFRVRGRFSGLRYCCFHSKRRMSSNLIYKRSVFNRIHDEISYSNRAIFFNKFDPANLFLFNFRARCLSHFTFRSANVDVSCNYHASRAITSFSTIGAFIRQAVLQSSDFIH